ncbi:hypothetical protein HDV00_004587 [Rhizophlyctis rosea]|nr:hypothetical protein HDV00_004587 [Rhizophlyctis rosea]
MTFDQATATVNPNSRLKQRMEEHMDATEANLTSAKQALQGQAKTLALAVYPDVEDEQLDDMISNPDHRFLQTTDQAVLNLQRLQSIQEHIDFVLIPLLNLRREMAGSADDDEVKANVIYSDVRQREVLEIPCGASVSWVAISHVWDLDGNPTLSLIRGPNPEVTATTTAGQELLLDICVQLGIEYIWVDFWCIDQYDQRAKIHEVERMAWFYAAAERVLIFPAGIGNKPTLEECFSGQDARWWERAWTLQEGALNRKRMIVHHNESGEVRTLRLDKGMRRSTEGTVQVRGWLKAVTNSRPKKDINVTYQVDKARADRIEAVFGERVLSLGEVLRECLLREAHFEEDKVFGCIRVILGPKAFLKTAPQYGDGLRTVLLWLKWMLQEDRTSTQEEGNIDSLEVDAADSLSKQPLENFDSLVRDLCSTLDIHPAHLPRHSTSILSWLSRRFIPSPDHKRPRPVGHLYSASQLSPSRRYVRIRPCSAVLPDETLQIDQSLIQLYISPAAQSYKTYHEVALTYHGTRSIGAIPMPGGYRVVPLAEADRKVIGNASQAREEGECKRGLTLPPIWGN